MKKREKEDKISNQQNNDSSFFWVTDKEQKSEIRKTLAKNFVIEYLNYCSKNECFLEMTPVRNI